MHQKMSFGELPQDDALRKGGLHHVPPSFPRGFTAGPQSGEAHIPLAEGTRECPVCHARCFSDMDVCYNCLHSFAQDGQAGDPCESTAYGKGALRVGPGAASTFLGGNSVGAGSVQDPSPADVSCCHPASVALPAEGVLESASAPAVADMGKKIELVISLSLGQDAFSGQSFLAPSVKVETR